MQIKDWKMWGLSDRNYINYRCKHFKCKQSLKKRMPNLHQSLSILLWLPDVISAGFCRFGRGLDSYTWSTKISAIWVEMHYKGKQLRHEDTRWQLERAALQHSLYSGTKTTAIAGMLSLATHHCAMEKLMHDAQKSARYITGSSPFSTIYIPRNSGSVI